MLFLFLFIFFFLFLLFFFQAEDGIRDVAVTGVQTCALPIRGILQVTVDFVREQARPWIDSKADKASDDVFTVSAVGDLFIRLHAAEALLERAGRQLDATLAQVDLKDRKSVVQGKSVDTGGRRIIVR